MTTKTRTGSIGQQPLKERIDFTKVALGKNVEAVVVDAGGEPIKGAPAKGLGATVEKALAGMHRQVAGSVILIVSSTTTPTGELLAGLKQQLHHGEVEAEAAAKIRNVLAPDLETPLGEGFLIQVQRNAALASAIGREFGLYSAKTVADLAGSSASNAAATASRWRAAERIFSVDIEGKPLFPGFQFDAETYKPKPVIAEVIAAFGPAAVSGWALASWFVANNSRLRDEGRPVDLMDNDPTAVVEAAAARVVPYGG